MIGYVVSWPRSRSRYGRAVWVRAPHADLIILIRKGHRTPSTTTLDWNGKRPERLELPVLGKVEVPNGLCQPYPKGKYRLITTDIKRYLPLLEALRG